MCKGQFPFLLFDQFDIVSSFILFSFVVLHYCFFVPLTRVVIIFFVLLSLKILQKKMIEMQFVSPLHYLIFVPLYSLSKSFFFSYLVHVYYIILFLAELTCVTSHLV